jgi:hypothetical protein
LPLSRRVRSNKSLMVNNRLWRPKLETVNYWQQMKISTNLRCSMRAIQVIARLIIQWPIKCHFEITSGKSVTQRFNNGATYLMM